MSREEFIGKFKSFADASAAKEVSGNDFQTIMPWAMYAGMKDKDLSAIYAYLRTVKPLTNAVTRFEAKPLTD